MKATRLAVLVLLLVGGVWTFRAQAAQAQFGSFMVQSKTSGQQKWQLEDRWDVVPGTLEEAEARAQAQAAFDALLAAHSGGTREYRMVHCTELAYEVRP